MCAEEDERAERTDEEVITVTQNSRPVRNRSIPDRYTPGAYISESMDYKPKIPDNYQEALNSPFREKWIEAMNSEMESLYENKTWESVERPKNDNVITGRWVYTLKLKGDGTIDRFKA